MYSAQRLYFNENPMHSLIQKMTFYFEQLTDILRKGILAAQLAEEDPTNREAILRILADD